MRAERFLGRFALCRCAGLVLVLAAVALAAPAEAARRVALVIGNGEYRQAPRLINPRNDADAVQQRLRAAGFEVVVGTDLTRRDTEDALKRFARLLGEAEVALFYYSGHAVQVAGRNFLVPVDAAVESEADLELAGVDLDTVLGFMQSRTPLQLVFLDACRDNPFRDKPVAVGAVRQVASVGRGLARPAQGRGTLIAFATEPGNVALDGSGALSPFTEAFTRHVLSPGLEVRQLLTRVRNDVGAATGGRQTPWENSALTRDFFFVEQKAPPQLPASQTVRLPVAAGPFALQLAQPSQPAGGSVRLVFDSLPASGTLLIGGQPVKAGEPVDAAAVAALAFAPADPKPGTVEVVGLRALDDFGGEARGMLAIALDSTVAAPVASARPDPAAVAAAAARVEQARPAAPAGTGAQPLFSASALGRQDLAVTVAQLPASGTLLLGDQPLPAGTRLAAADLGRVAFLPDPDRPEAAETVTLRLSDPRGGAAVEAKATVTGTIEACDAEAGEPFDPQGVGKGRLPNEIRAAAAIEACSKAVAAHPEIPRFLYQLGRAELASGNVGVARAAYERAAARGHVRSLYGLGMLHIHRAFEGADRAKGFALLEEGAAKSDPYAMHALGKRLLSGEGIAADIDRGFRLLSRAADFGHTYAMNELGFQYKTGRALPKDLARAVAYYRASVARDDIYGLNNLALMLRDGLGVSPDLEEAYRLFVRAARGGQPDAPFNLGRMHEQGTGVARDVKQAAQWYELGLERGDPWSALRLADLTLAGAPGKKDPARAAQILARAAALERGAPSAEAREKLASLPAAAQKAAALALAEQLGLGKAREGDALLARAAKARGAQVPPDLETLTVALARDLYLRSRPRFDLF